jgi:hypothetical protein
VSESFRISNFRREYAESPTLESALGLIEELVADGIEGSRAASKFAKSEQHLWGSHQSFRNAYARSVFVGFLEDGGGTGDLKVEAGDTALAVRRVLQLTDDPILKCRAFVQLYRIAVAQSRFDLIQRLACRMKLRCEGASVYLLEGMAPETCTVDLTCPPKIGPGIMRVLGG